MKKAKYSRIFLILISLMLVTMLIPTVSATVYTNEDFEDEANGANPSSAWYSYAEDGDFSTANVSTGLAYGGTQSFYINDSANDAVSWANFTFTTVTYYDTFYFRFRIPDVDWHNSTNVTFVDSSSQILGYAYITNTTLYFNNTASNIMNVSITDDYWYRVLVDFNLTTDQIGCYVYNDSNSGALLGSGWGDMEDGAGTYADVEQVRFSAASGTKTSMYIDDLRRAYTYINPNAATNLAVVGAVTALFAVAILLQIIAVAYSGQVNPYSLVMLAVTVIIGVVTLQIVAGL